MATRAIQYLKQKRVTFEVVKYVHDEKGARFAASATGISLEMTFKTLVVGLGDRRYCMVLIPGNRRLDFRRLASFSGVKKATLATTESAERLTGYLVGGISPFATKHSLPAVLDEQARGYDSIMINGGQRGVMLKMTPADIEMTLNCRVAAISRD